MVGDLKNDESFEALSGLPSQKKVVQVERDSSRLVAFYLPQFHRIPENSEWWGEGFTEWTNAAKARPNFQGHYQPHIPRHLGFYDLSNPSIMGEQAQMAKFYGVQAFCFYYYWFSGRRILEKPLENFLASDINIEFCVCWANENWTRTWDGGDNNILMDQKYLDADPEAFIESLIPFFSDRRYIKVNGNPMLLVYRAKAIPKVLEVFDRWRSAAKNAGLPGLHLVVVDFYDVESAAEVGADALVEFPPHKFIGEATAFTEPLRILNKDFKGWLLDYRKVILKSINRTPPNFTLYRGIVPSWDNTARRRNTPAILVCSTPSLFEKWLRYLRAYTREAFLNKEDNFIFINAWNEWGEGCHLEPDLKWGLGYLDAIYKSSLYDPNEASRECVKQEVTSEVEATQCVLHDIDVEESYDDTENRRRKKKLYKRILDKLFFRI